MLKYKNIHNGPLKKDDSLIKVCALKTMLYWYSTDCGSCKLCGPGTSIWPPDGLIHSSTGVEYCRGAAVTAVGIHPIRLAAEVGVDQGTARRGASARWEHPRR